MMARWLVPFRIDMGARAALAMAIPLCTLFALGRLDLVVYAVFGAFTALYGRNEPYRVRIRSVSVGALGMLSGIALGLLFAVVGAPLLLLTLVLLVVVGVGVLVATVWDIIPAQPLFFVFGLLVCARIPTHLSDVGLRFAVAFLSALLSALLAMAGWLVRRILLRWEIEPATQAIFLKKLRRFPERDIAALRDGKVWLTVTLNLLGVLIAGGIALSMNLSYAYWAVITVVAALPSARAEHSISRALHRTVGTIVGVGLTIIVLGWSPPTVFVIGAIIVCQFFAQMLLGLSYGGSMVFITPLALCVSYLATPRDLDALLLDRVVETVLGAAVAVALVLAARALTHSSVRGTKAPSR